MEHHSMTGLWSHRGRGRAMSRDRELLSNQPRPRRQLDSCNRRDAALKCIHRVTFRGNVLRRSTVFKNSTAKVSISAVSTRRGSCWQGVIDPDQVGHVGSGDGEVRDGENPAY